jgi:hypothetical protein
LLLQIAKPVQHSRKSQQEQPNKTSENESTTSKYLNVFFELSYIELEYTLK